MKMRLHLECLACNINQVIKIMNILNIEMSKRETIMSEVLKMLASVDYTKCNPEIMKETWKIIVEHTGIIDPYESIKEYYNKELLKMVKPIIKIIENSNQPLQTALKIAIAGNLIDFAAKHSFSMDALWQQIERMESYQMGKDDSEALCNDLKNAKTVLYLGDNCGEIVLDKIFIQILKNYYDIDVYYGVRGQPIVNDVTKNDAKVCHMEEVANVIDNGDGSLGTVLSLTSPAFQEVFHKADIVIAKGQGNFESLSEIKNKNMFYLFMVKCEVVATMAKVKAGEIICMKNGNR